MQQVQTSTSRIGISSYWTCSSSAWFKNLFFDVLVLRLIRYCKEIKSSVRYFSLSLECRTRAPTAIQRLILARRNTFFFGSEQEVASARCILENYWAKKVQRDKEILRDTGQEKLTAFKERKDCSAHHYDEKEEAPLLPWEATWMHFDKVFRWSFTRCRYLWRRTALHNSWASNCEPYRTERCKHIAIAVAVAREIRHVVSASTKVSELVDSMRRLKSHCLLFSALLFAYRAFCLTAEVLWLTDWLNDPLSSRLARPLSWMVIYLTSIWSITSFRRQCIT